MKNITKDNKGITLVALVITIILMLILVSVTTFNGIKLYNNTKVNRFVIQMQLIQTKIDDLVTENTIEELNELPLQTITTDEQTNAIATAFEQEEISNADTSKYKVFTEENVLEILDVEDVYNDILVNFETREVVSTVGVKYNDGIYYTQYKLPNGQTVINENNETNRNLDFNINTSMDGLNASVIVNNIKIINGTLTYKEENDSYWQLINDYIENDKTYNVVISKSGNYIFKLQDNTNIQNYKESTIEVKLINKPRTTNELEDYNYALDSANWAYSVDSKGNNYVWIPRFVYDIENNIKYIKGNSNIATDNTYIEDEWIIHSKFTTDKGIGLTGIWVSVSSSEVKKNGNNMIMLLNDNTRKALIEI